MTDEVRIARLTELARRVWPEATIEVRGDYWEIRHRHSSMKVDDDYYQCVWTSPRQPERAADALEAALLVLAGEHGALLQRAIVEVETRSDLRGAHAAEVALAVLRVAQGITNPLTADVTFGEPVQPAWLEAWAKELEDPCMQGDMRPSEVARELRERAKRGEP